MNDEQTLSQLRARRDNAERAGYAARVANFDAQIAKLEPDKPNKRIAKKAVTKKAPAKKAPAKKVAAKKK